MPDRHPIASNGMQGIFALIVEAIAPAPFDRRASRQRRWPTA
jgi:hypothetical protein